MSESRKVFIISLDGATFDVLNPLVAQGYMPHLGELMSTAVTSDLNSVIPPVTAPAWTSFMTGKHPSKHGILDFSRFDPQCYGWKINSARDIRSKTLWQILSENGKRMVVLNLPYTYPPSDVNGVVVSGWDAPLTDDRWSHPADISGCIVRRFPDYKHNLWVSDLQPLRSDAQFEEFTRKLKSGFEQQAKVALDLVRQEAWDVFMVHFQQTDWIQHKLWSYIDAGCRQPDNHDRVVEATRECYRCFDHWVGSLLDAPKPCNASTFVLSDHGFGRLMGELHPNHYLQQWGYLSVIPHKNNRIQRVKQILHNSASGKVRQVYRSLASAKARFTTMKSSYGAHKSWTDNATNVMGSRGAQWDWSRTKAAMVYAYQMGFVFVNVKDHGGVGVVASRREYDSILDDLTSRFQELRNPKGSEKLLLDVKRCSEVYPPADHTFVPDLVLIPRDGYGFSFSLGPDRLEVSDEGTHRHNGVLIAAGPGIKSPGSHMSPQLIDLAPTVLHIVGLRIPTDMDGRVLGEILANNSPVQFEDIDNSLCLSGQSYSDGEQNIIAQRLQGLGYLD